MLQTSDWMYWDIANGQWIYNYWVTMVLVVMDGLRGEKRDTGEFKAVDGLSGEAF